MRYVLITDTHFGHDMLWEEGFRPKGFEAKILSGLRAMLTEDSVLIHLGDVSFYRGGDFGVLGLGQWRSYLVRGNHDKGSHTQYIKQGWDWVGDRMTLDAFGVRWVFSHVPVVMPKDGQVVVHGHTHGNDHRHSDVHPVYSVADRAPLIDFSLEKTGYKPVLLKSLARAVLQNPGDWRIGDP